MRFGGLQRLSLIDYPGSLSCVLFTLGCNFRCPYCYNPALVLETAEPISEDSILSFLSERKKYLDAVVLTGGEPTCQEDLSDFAAKLKGMGYLVGLETNGSKPRVLEELIDKGLVDYISMDVKAPLERYSEIAGADVDASLVERSIRLLLGGGVEYSFATTCFPALHRDDFSAIFKLISGAKRYRLQQFQKKETLEKTSLEPYPDSFLCELKAEAEKYALEVELVAGEAGFSCQ